MPLIPKDPAAQHDREIAAIRKLVLTGMRMLNSLTESQQEMRASLRQLRESQRETDRQLQLLIRSLQRGGNGHARRSIS